MGTRGFMGIVVDGELKGSYNHFDSYPTCLGENVVRDIRAMTLEEMRGKARGLKVVQESGAPTSEEIATLCGYANEGVSSGDPEEWYVLLHDLQGELAKTLEAGYILDGTRFPADSLFCEWGYVVDLDAETLEVYRGFQKERPATGRFRDMPKDGDYFPIALVATFKLDDIPDGAMKRLEEAAYEG